MIWNILLATKPGPISVIASERPTRRDATEDLLKGARDQCKFEKKKEEKRRNQ